MSGRGRPETNGRGMPPVEGRSSPAGQGMHYTQHGVRGSPGHVTRSDIEHAQKGGHMSKHQWPPDDSLSSTGTSDRTGAGIELQPLASSCLPPAQDTMQSHHTYPIQDNPIHPPPPYNHSSHQTQLGQLQPQLPLIPSQQGVLPNIRIAGEDNISLRGSPLHQARYPAVRDIGQSGVMNTGSIARDYGAWVDLEDSMAIRNGCNINSPTQQGPAYTQQHLTGQDLSQSTPDKFNSPASSGTGMETASTGGLTDLSHHHPLSDHAKQMHGDSPGPVQGDSGILPPFRNSKIDSLSSSLLQGETGESNRLPLSSPTSLQQLGNGKAGDNILDSFQQVSLPSQPGNSTNGAHSQEKSQKKGAGWARLRANKPGDNGARQGATSPGLLQGTERASSRNTIHPEGNETSRNGHSNQATVFYISN